MNNSSDTSIIVKEYELKRPLYEEFARKLSLLLSEILEVRNLHWDSVDHRAKAVESFRQKITRPGKLYTNPLAEITDLAGLRIVLYYLEDVHLISQIIREEFVIDETNSMDKATLLAPNEFGYRSVHFVVSLGAQRKSLPEWARFAELKAEIQVRTVLQHAWASISRALDYNREDDAPKELRRRLFRLSGLLELADEEFTTLSQKQQKITAHTNKQINAGNLDLEINSSTLKSYFDKSPIAESNTQLAVEAGFTIDNKRVKAERHISPIVALCTKPPSLSLRQFDQTLHSASTWALEYFQLLIAADRKEGRTWYINKVFANYLLLIRARIENLSEADFLQQGWSKNVATHVITIARSHAKLPTN